MTRPILIAGIGDEALAAGGGAAEAPCDLRCRCGCLVARMADDLVELKCRRCGRTLPIPVQPGP